MKKIKTLPLPVEPAQEPEESWRVIDIPIWKGKLFIYVGPYEKFFDRLLEGGWPKESVDELRKERPYDENNEALTVNVKGSGQIAIWCEEPISKPTLVHELCHAVHMLFRSRECEDEEAFCYTLEYLFREATK